MPPESVDPEHFSPDLREFLILLSKHEVNYLIVGGEAVVYYGHARLTGDIDIFYAFDKENVQKLYHALDAFWSGKIPGFSGPEDFSKGVIVQFGLPPNRLDLLNDISGVQFDDAWPDRLEVSMQAGNKEVNLNYIGLDALIRNKQASGRPKDLDDLTFLQLIPNND